VGQRARWRRRHRLLSCAYSGDVFRLRRARALRAPARASHSGRGPTSRPPNAAASSPPSHGRGDHDDDPLPTRLLLLLIRRTPTATSTTTLFPTSSPTTSYPNRRLILLPIRRGEGAGGSWRRQQHLAESGRRAARLSTWSPTPPRSTPPPCRSEGAPRRSAQAMCNGDDELQLRRGRGGGRPAACSPADPAT
jgi:hypothetical protein